MRSSPSSVVKSTSSEEQSRKPQGQAALQPHSLPSSKAKCRLRIHTRASMMTGTMMSRKTVHLKALTSTTIRKFPCHEVNLVSACGLAPVPLTVPKRQQFRRYLELLHLGSQCQTSQRFRYVLSTFKVARQHLLLLSPPPSHTSRQEATHPSLYGQVPPRPTLLFQGSRRRMVGIHPNRMRDTRRQPWAGCLHANKLEVILQHAVLRDHRYRRRQHRTPLRPRRIGYDLPAAQISKTHWVLQAVAVRASHPCLMFRFHLSQPTSLTHPTSAEATMAHRLWVNRSNKTAASLDQAQWQTISHTSRPTSHPLIHSTTMDRDNLRYSAIT